MKTYVICTTLEKESYETLKRLKFEIELKDVSIHIVSIIEIQIYNAGLVPYIYPNEHEYKDIEESAIPFLNSLATSMGANSNQIINKCLFATNRESKIREYLEEVNADLVITATKRKHGIAGLFYSSFTDYLCKFSPCDVLVMRPVQK